VLFVLVEDNGKGFDEHALQELDRGTGMKSVRNRTALLGGKVSVESTPGKGTLARVFLPLNGL
jgi:signal transduction histidine kinase